MRHPFAVVPCPRPQSFLPVRSRPATPDRGHTPHPTSSKEQPLLDSPPPVPPLPSFLPLGNLVPNRSPPRSLSTKKDACGHYVKHSSKLTLLLSGQREGICVPHYSNGDTIEGVLAIARPSGVLALEVKVEGTIQVQEMAGAGSFNVKVINEKIYSWSAASQGSFPPKASFRYTLPSTYLDSTSNKPYLLPPSYCEELHGIPGFSVKIAYAVVVNLTLLREPSTLWRGVSNVKVPFRYSHRTRPVLPGPFRCSPEKSPTCPRTLFIFQMRSVREDVSSIKVHLYLPSSTVCCHQEPIPFHITLFADALTMERFAEYRPMPSSFLPLGQSASISASCESVHTHLSSRKAALKNPLKIKVQRTTLVDAGSAGFTFPPFYPKHKAKSARDLLGDEEATSSTTTSTSTSTSSAKSDSGERSYMYSMQSIGQGVVYNASRHLNSVGWSGAIIIPPSPDGFNGGFEVNGLKVVDSIVLSIDPPPAIRALYLPLNETILVRLTSDPVKSHIGIPVSSVG